MWFHDPPGSTAVDTLLVNGNGNHRTEFNYILFHDQEPIYPDIHRDLFVQIEMLNSDLCDMNFGAIRKGIVTSEYNSDALKHICNLNQWNSYYYFFHGWAALDWYRGYDKTYLMSAPETRVCNKAFINPNRIIGGKRDHRVLLMYHILKNQSLDAWISCPKVCPVENMSINDIAMKFIPRYNDIVDVLSSANLPMHMPDEYDHPMHSCWLSLFDQCEETLAYVVTETAFFGRKNHLTEKTFKPICLRMPFVLASTAGSLEYLKMYGFKTFDSIWDESYDSETDDLLRLEKIAALLKSLNDLSVDQRTSMLNACIPILEHNYQHFYGGGFEKVLWAELQGMLNQMQIDYNP